MGRLPNLKRSFRATALKYFATAIIVNEILRTGGPSCSVRMATANRRLRHLCQDHRCKPMSAIALRANCPGPRHPAHLCERNGPWAGIPSAPPSMRQICTAESPPEQFWTTPYVAATSRPLGVSLRASPRVNAKSAALRRASLSASAGNAAAADSPMLTRARL